MTTTQSPPFSSSPSSSTSDSQKENAEPTSKIWKRKCQFVLFHASEFGLPIFKCKMAVGKSYRMPDDNQVGVGRPWVIDVLTTTQKMYVIEQIEVQVLCNTRQVITNYMAFSASVFASIGTGLHCKTTQSDSTCLLPIMYSRHISEQWIPIMKYP